LSEARFDQISRTKEEMAEEPPFTCGEGQRTAL